MTEMKTEKSTCGECGRSWDDSADPAPSALCHWCHGRGYSTAPICGDETIKTTEARWDCPPPRTMDRIGALFADLPYGYWQVSSGTLRIPDLVHAYDSALTEIRESLGTNPPGDPDALLSESAWQGAIDALLGSVELRTGFSAGMVDDEWDAKRQFQAEKSLSPDPMDTDLLDTYQDILEAICPDGFQFGSNEGDGAAIGFWPVDDDDE